MPGFLKGCFVTLYFGVTILCGLAILFVIGWDIYDCIEYNVCD